MDILNYISWVKENKIITTISDLNSTLIPIGLKDPRRDDDYLSVGISVASLAAIIGGGSGTGTVTSVGATAGTGISIAGTNPITTSGTFTITNTAPDKVVTLSNGDGISTSGTYPNFTITNTEPDQTVVLTDGTGITTTGTYPAFTITNSAPDQVVSITDGTGISTTGTYPNFTITNTSPSSGGTVTSVELTSGTGISLSGTNPITSSGTINITNSAPDQTVSLTDGTGISTSGTYPNFTITNIAPDQTVSLTDGTGISVTGSYPSFTITNTQPSSGGTVTSVDLTMPSAFNVANNPITSAGTINVTAAGVASQYVRGDGVLASFPDISGGGGGQVFYFNGGTSQGTIGGNAFKQLSAAAVIGIGVDFTSTSVNDVVFANFITDVGKPTQETIPAGVWIFQCYLSASSTSNCEVYAKVEVYDGSTFTVLSTSLHEVITNGTTIDLYTFTCAVPEYTPLTPTDRIAIRFYPTNLGGSRTITLHTQDSHLGSVQTTFTTGVASIDGLTAAAQYLSVGTTGADFNITTSSVDTHVFNLPTASASNRGALSTSDWSTFNSKESALTFSSPLSRAVNTISIPVATGSVNGYLSSVDWTTFNNKQNAFTGYDYEIHVSLGTGNDTSGTGKLLLPYASITKALSVATNADLIIVHPGTYNENPTSNVYAPLITVNDSADKTIINGTLTLASATRVKGFKINNLIISNNSSTYIDDCNILTSFTKSGNGFVQIDNTTLQCSSGSLISGSGITVINGDYLYPLVVNNAGANVIVKISNSIVTPNVLAGSLAIVDSILVSATPTGNAITSSSGTVVTLANSQILVPTLDNVARVNLQGFYSIFNCVFDKPNSTLVSLSATGGPTNSIDYFQYINADKFITQGGTSSQFVKGDGTLGTSVSGTVTSVSALTLGTIGTDLSSTVANGTTTPVITLNVPTASASNRGALSSTDWTTFNNKVSTTRTISTNAPLSGGGDLSADRTLSITQSNTTTDGYLSGTDWTTFNNKIGGSGTLSYVPRYTASGTIGNSLIQDNTTTVGIGGLLATSQFYITQNALQYGVYSTNGYATGVTYGGSFRSTAVKAASNVGIEASATGSTGLNIAVSGSANGSGTAKNYGGSFIAGNGTANYSLRLLDGSEGSGKFLKDVTGNGEARWTNITTADISGLLTGSGTADYMTRFVTSTILGNSIIRDNGTNVGVNVAPSTNCKFGVNTSTAAQYAIYGEGLGQGFGGVAGITSGVGALQNIGVYGSSSGSTTLNIGVQGEIDNALSVNIGGQFSATSGSANYSLQLQDGTETVGRFLKCITSDGKANWAALPTFALTYFTEAQSTAAPNATVPVDSLTAVSSATNADFAIIPKGTGAILRQIPDNTTAGGNKRGANAIDLQYSRAAATQVASGAGSIAMGNNNTVSGINAIAIGTTNVVSGDNCISVGNTNNNLAGHCFGQGNNINSATAYFATAFGTSNICSIRSSFASGTSNTVSSRDGAAFGASNTISADYSYAFGSSNTVSGIYSTALGISCTASGAASIALGKGANTGISRSKLALSSGFEATSGDSQFGIQVLKNRTTGNTATRLYSDSPGAAASTQVYPPLNGAYRFKGTIIGKQTGTLNAAAWDIDGIIVKGATEASVSLLIGNVVLVQNTPAWGTPTLTADTATIAGTLNISVTGAATTNIQWVCSVQTTEVIY